MHEATGGHTSDTIGTLHSALTLEPGNSCNNLESRELLHKHIQDQLQEIRLDILVKTRILLREKFFAEGFVFTDNLDRVIAGVSNLNAELELQDLLLRQLLLQIYDNQIQRRNIINPFMNNSTGSEQGNTMSDTEPQQGLASGVEPNDTNQEIYRLQKAIENTALQISTLVEENLNERTIDYTKELGDDLLDEFTIKELLFKRHILQIKLGLMRGHNRSDRTLDSSIPAGQ